MTSTPTPRSDDRSFERPRSSLNASNRRGSDPSVLPGGAGLTCDIGEGEPVVALRADLDALPIPDEKVGTPYRSTVARLVPCLRSRRPHRDPARRRVGLAAAQMPSGIKGRVRLVFQPAEESMPGGALDVIAAGAVDGVRRILALHCDPRHDVGRVGVRVGPITGSSDHVRVDLTSIGGHTARPHLTGDLVYALAKVVTDVPSVLSSRVDPRAGLSVVWGQVHAGGAANVIPQHGHTEGTVRSLDALAWEHAPQVVTDAVESVVAPYGVQVDVDYTRGVPPVNNDAESVALIERAARVCLVTTA